MHHHQQKKTPLNRIQDTQTQFCSESLRRQSKKTYSVRWVIVIVCHQEIIAHQKLVLDLEI